MAYTDLTSTFVYKSLLTYQLMADLAVNDKLFNDQLTGSLDVPNDLHLANAKYLRGDVAATGTWYKLIGLDASNIVQVGDALTEVRLPADPTNVLGAATKQYVDGAQMFETQPKVSGTAGGSGTYATILNLTATKRGHIRALTVKANSNGDNISIRITIDGGTPVVITVNTVSTNSWRGLLEVLLFSSTDLLATEDLVSSLLDISFASSLLVEASSNNGIAATVHIVYDKI